MQQELALRAITHTSIAIVILSLLLVLLIALRKENNGGGPTRGVVFLGIVVLGLCVFMALMAALFGAKGRIVPETISSRLDTADSQMKQRFSSHFSRDLSAKGSQ
jgi:Na+/melibiose symporter-like transporter